MTPSSPSLAGLATLTLSACTALPPLGETARLGRASEDCRTAIEATYATPGYVPPVDPAAIERACEPVWALRQEMADDAVFPPDYERLVGAYSNLAARTFAPDDPARSAAYLRRAIQISEDTESSLALRSGLYASFAHTYRDRRPDEYARLAREALALAEQSGDLYTIATRHRDLARMHQHLGDLAAAEASYTQEIATYQELRKRAETGRPPDNPRVRGNSPEAQQLRRDIALRNLDFMRRRARQARERVQTCRRYQDAFPPERASLCCRGLDGIELPGTDTPLDCTLPRERPR